MTMKWFDWSSRVWTLLLGLTLLLWGASPLSLVAQDGILDLSLELDDEEDEPAEDPDEADVSVDLLLGGDSNASDIAADSPLILEPDENDSGPAPAPTAPQGSTADTPQKQLEEDFKDYLQYAVMGRFQPADAFAQSLLENPLLTPKLTQEGADQLVALTKKYERSEEMLRTLVSRAGIGENAAEVQRLIDESYRMQRMKPELILQNIRLLAGSPMEWKVGLDRLRDSGEYAIPWMLVTLADAEEKDLHPFVIRALPQLGKRTVEALIVGLQHSDPNVRAVVAITLGKLGYPRALPYLKKHTLDLEENVAVRDAAAASIQMIVESDPGARELPADILFAQLAERYYADAQTLRPDPREDRANVWFMQRGVLSPIEVPRDVYRYVMCMRTTEESLALAPNRVSVAALWLAANLQRESALGLDVESGEKPNGEVPDNTRPPNYPRSLYFARALGPRICQLTLRRAVTDLDRDVALGAIAGLRENAGPAGLTSAADPEGLSLAGALAFPELYVRIRAALAMGRALPPMAFRGAEQVVPVLASALNLKGDRYFLVVEPDERVRRAIVDGLGAEGISVISGDRLPQALDRAHAEFSHLDGLILASNMSTPSVYDAIQTLNEDTRFSLAPIVVLIKQGDAIKTDPIRELDPRVGLVLDASVGQDIDPGVAEALLDEQTRVAERYQHQSISPELGLELALEAAHTLRLIAESGRTPFDTGRASRELIQALTYDSEELRIAAGRSLALIDDPKAQQAIATLALDPSQSESLRIAQFDALSESARHFGARLMNDQVTALMEQGMNEPNLALRTAAGKALGAMNLSVAESAQIILAQPEP